MADRPRPSEVIHRETVTVTIDDVSRDVSVVSYRTEIPPLPPDLCEEKQDSEPAVVIRHVAEYDHKGQHHGQIMNCSPDAPEVVHSRARQTAAEHLVHSLFRTPFLPITGTPREDVGADHG